MNKNCFEYNYTQTVKDGEGWIIYISSFSFMVFETHVMHMIYICTDILYIYICVMTKDVCMLKKKNL